MKLTTFFQKFGTAALPRWLRRKLKKLIGSFRKTAARWGSQAAATAAKTALAGVVLVGVFDCFCTQEVRAADVVVNNQQSETKNGYWYHISGDYGGHNDGGVWVNDTDYFNWVYYPFTNAWISDTSSSNQLYDFDGTGDNNIIGAINRSGTTSGGTVTLTTTVPGLDEVSHSTSNQNGTTPEGSYTHTQYQSLLNSHKSYSGNSAINFDASTVNLTLGNGATPNYTISNIIKNGTGTLSINNNVGTITNDVLFDGNAGSIINNAVLNSSGTVTVGGISSTNQFTFGGSGNWNISGNTGMIVDGYFTRTQTGQLNITNGVLTVNNNAVFTNTGNGTINANRGWQNNGTFNDTSTSGIVNIGSSSGDLNNSGTFSKTGGGELNVIHNFNNVGTATISGTSTATIGDNLNNNGVSSSIAINTTGDTTVNGYVYNEGTITKTGSGDITVKGTDNTTGNVNNGWRNTITGKFEDDGSGNFILSSTAKNLQNDGTFTKDGSGNFTIADGHFYNTGTATLGGSVVSTINDYIHNTDVFNDASSGNLTVSGAPKYGNNDFSGSSGRASGAAVYNEGIYNKSGSGTTTLTGDFDTRFQFYGTNGSINADNYNILISGYGRWDSSGTMTGEKLVIGHVDAGYNPEQFHVTNGTINLGGTTEIGLNAAGHLHIADATVNSGDSIGDKTYVGSQTTATATGVVQIDNGGIWNTKYDDVIIGNFGGSTVTQDRGNNIAYFNDNSSYYSNDPLTNTQAALNSSQTGTLTKGASTNYSGTNPLVGTTNYGATGQGTVNLNGGTWDATGQTVTVGQNGSGAVNMSGGTWTDARTIVGSGSHETLAAGENRGIVNQFGGIHTDTGNAVIGDANNGTYDLHGSDSTIWNTQGSATIANTNGVIGQVNVYEDANWNVTGNLVVGNNTGTDGRGILRIDNRSNAVNNNTNGGDVTVINGNVIMARAANAQGYTYVDGYGSTLTANTGSLTVANGQDSYGRLDVSRGGKVEIQANDATIANATGSHGQAYVHGTDGAGNDATWTIHGSGGGDSLIVANTGTAEGLLDIYKKGDVVVTTGNVVIANDAGTFGTINVRNLGSTFEINAGTLTVAEEGTGLLHISDRGKTTVSSNMTIANTLTARGTTIVELFGTLDVNGNLTTSTGGGEGNLYVRSGSKVNVAGNHTIANTSGSLGRDHIDGNFTELNIGGDLNVAASGQAGGRYTENRYDPRWQESLDPIDGMWGTGSYSTGANQTGYISVSEGSENPLGEGTHTAQHGTGTAFNPLVTDEIGDAYTFTTTTGDCNVNPAYNLPYPSGNALPLTPNDGKYTGNDPGLAVTRGAHVNVEGNATVGDKTGSYAYAVIDNKGFNAPGVKYSENALDLNSQGNSAAMGIVNDASNTLATNHQNTGATRSTMRVGEIATGSSERTKNAADGVTNPVANRSDYQQINDTNGGLLTIGRNGGEGMFRVINGGLLHTGSTMIADVTGSRGYLHVSGFDSVSGRSEFISDGLTTVGNASGTRGTLRISNGARAVTEGLTIAKVAGSVGEVSVEGFHDRDNDGYTSDDVRSLLEIYQAPGGSAPETEGNSLFAASNHALVWMWEGSDLQLNGIGQITTGATLHLNGHVDSNGDLDSMIVGGVSGDAGIPLFDANDYSVNVTNGRVEGNGIIRAKEGISFVQDGGLNSAGQRRTPGQAEIDPGLFYGWDCICENPERYGTLQFETNTLNMTGNVITYFDVNDQGDHDRIIVKEDRETGRSDNVTASLSGTLKLNARLTEGYYNAGQDYVYDIITTENNGLVQRKFDNVDIVPFAFFELAETDLGQGQTIDRLKAADGTSNDGDILHVTMRAVADPFERAGRTYNQKSTGHALDQIYAERNTDWLPVLRYFWNQYNPKDFLAAYSLFSGEVRAHSLLMPTSDLWSVATDRIGFSRKTGHALLGYQNRNFGQEFGNGLWGSALYNQTSTSTDGNAYGYDLKRTGFVVGWDRVSQGGDSTTGALFHYNHGELETYRAGATDEDYQFGLYHARRVLDYFEWKNYLGFGLQSYRTHRSLDVPMQGYTVCGVPSHSNSCPTGSCNMANGICMDCNCDGSLEEQRLRSRYHGYTFSASTELARPYYFGEMRQWTFRPFVGLNINAVWQNRAWEQGDFNGAELVALQFESANLFRTYGRVGAGLERGGNHANMYMNATYSYLLGGRRYTDVDNRFQFGGDEFNIRGVDDGSGFFTANVGGSIFLDRCKRGMAFMEYKVIAGSHSSTQAFQLGLQRNF
jgi:T5SS/PEP-CTERM-associated repeat protein